MALECIFKYPMIKGVVNTEASAQTDSVMQPKAQKDVALPIQAMSNFPEN